MTITGELDRLRAAVPGCTTVAYADLSSGLVLSVSAARRQQQETLDALAIMSTALVEGDGPARAQGVLDDSGRIEEALRLSPGETLAVLRSAVDPAEALCCVGTGDVDVDLLVREARRALDRIGEAS